MRNRTLLSLAVALVAGAVGCGDPDIVVPDVLWVEIAPTHGATDIDTSVDVLAYFWSAVADPQAAAGVMTLECVGMPPCRSADGSGCPASTSFTVRFEPGDRIAHLTPDASLQAGTCYQVRIAEGIAAAEQDVGPLPVDIRSSFQTRP